MCVRRFALNCSLVTFGINIDTMKQNLNGYRDTLCLLFYQLNLTFSWEKSMVTQYLRRTERSWNKSWTFWSPAIPSPF